MNTTQTVIGVSMIAHSSNKNNRNIPSIPSININGSHQYSNKQHQLFQNLTFCLTSFGIGKLW